MGLWRRDPKQAKRWYKSTPQIIENSFDIIELQTALKAMQLNLNSFDTISITQNRAKHYTFNIKNANDQSSIT
ncbi:MAG: hypothetical protein SOW11_06300, partial [Campylobacter lanienae]|nr:hypothetical protein [Campylobacter lanienae]